MPNDDISQYLALGSELHGTLLTSTHDGYENTIHMVQAGSGPFKHYRVAYHSSYDRINTKSDIETLGFQAHYVEIPS